MFALRYYGYYILGGTPRMSFSVILVSLVFFFVSPASFTFHLFSNGVVVGLRIYLYGKKNSHSSGDGNADLDQLSLASTIALLCVDTALQ